MGIFGAAMKGFGMLGKGKGKTVVKNTNPPMIKIKPKPKGTTPKNLDNQKNVKVSSKPAILGKETYNYEGLKEVKGSKSMKEKSKPIKLPPKKDSPKKSGTTLSAIKESNPALYKKYMRNLGKTTSKPSRFLERRMTLKGPKLKDQIKESFKTPGAIKFKKSFDAVMGDNKGLIKKTLPLGAVAQGTTAILGKDKKKEKKK